jgi:hypothetical protein
MQAVATFYGAPTGAPGAGAPRSGNAGGPRQTPWPCIAMCATLIRGGPHLLLTTLPATYWSAEILSLPGKPRADRRSR